MRTKENFRGLYGSCPTPTGDTVAILPGNEIERDDDIFFHSCLGWISRSSAIMSTTDEIEGAREFVENSEANGCAIELPLNFDDPLFRYINIRFDNFLEKIEVDICGIAKVYICRHEPRYIFIKAEGDIWHNVVPETGKPEAIEDETFDAVNELTCLEWNQAAGEIPQPRISDRFIRSVKVGVVEQEHGCHADFIKELVTHKSIQADNSTVEMISPLHMVLSPFVTNYITIFDLICTLANPEYRAADVINVSQGYYSCVHNQCLLRVLDKLDKPIICSAGNAGTNNDFNLHWPSNFSTFNKTPNVIAVTAANNNDEINEEANVGVCTVTIAALDYIGSVGGSSISAAWTSRCIAAVIALGELNFDLPKVIVTLKDANLNPGPTYQVKELSARGRLAIANQIILTTGHGVA